MRPDMGRLIIEDGRHGHGGPATVYDKVRRAGDEYENLPTRESMSRCRKQNQNSIGDRLQPLRNYLAAQVGRPWNKVYSEICAVNDRRTIRAYHLLSHLKDYVQLKPDPANNRWPWHGFYVDRHGLLKQSKESPWRARRRAAKAAKPEITKVPISETERYEKINGLWFRVVAFVRHTTSPVWPEQIIERKGRLGLLTVPREVKVIKKFSCGKKELRKIGELLDAV
jgi:hypothetical protein